MSIIEQVTQPSAWITILISWLGSGFLTAILTGLYALRSAQNEYVNEYYKTVIKRRIAAYEKIDVLIAWLKASVLSAEGKPYHIIFHSTEEHDWLQPYGLVTDALSQGLWLSDEVFKKTRELSDLMFHLEKYDMVEFGKKNYEAIATIRAQLERLLAKDMLNLHDVRAFLKSKDKPDPGFRAFHVKDH
jgi:hypothetical protein